MFSLVSIKRSVSLNVCTCIVLHIIDIMLYDVYMFGFAKKKQKNMYFGVDIAVFKDVECILFSC